MPAQPGKDLLLKVDDGTGSFITVAGLRSRTLTFDSATVDVTHSESAGRWRELLAGAGVRRAGLTGAGIFLDSDSDRRVRAIFFSGDIQSWRVVIPEFGTIQGPFQVTALNYRGEHSGEVAFDMSLESAGAIDFDPA